MEDGNLESNSMTELEKMLAGQEFNSMHPSFIERNKLFQDGLDELNSIPRWRQQDRVEKSREVLGEIDDSDGPYIFPPTTFMIGKNTKLGKGVFINFNVTILDAAPVTIGDHTMIAPGTVISTVTHTLSARSRRKHNTVAAPINIGKDVWIGANCTIVPGVTIGDGAVIGAGAVVNKDIPAWSLAVGVPAKVVKQLENDVED